MLEKVERGVLVVERALVTLLLAVTFLSVVLQVFVRFLNLPIADTSELSLIAIASMTFLCIGLLTHKSGHISVEVTNLIRNEKALFVVRTLANVGILVFVGVFGMIAIDLMSFALERGEATVRMRIPLSVPYTTLVVGLVLAAFHALMNVKTDVATLRDPRVKFERVGDAAVAEVGDLVEASPTGAPTDVAVNPEDDVEERR